MYGAPRSMLIAANALAPDFDVEIITYGDGDLVPAAQEMGIQITVIEEPSFKFRYETRSPYFAQKIIKKINQKIITLKTFWLLMKKKPDLVYVNTIANELPIRMAVWLGLKVLVHVREGSNYIFPENSNHDKKIGYIFNNVKNFICVSEAVKKLVLLRLEGKKAIVNVVHNGIDCNDFRSQRDHKYDLVNPMGKKVVGFIGNLSVRKGVNIFIAAAKELAIERDDVIFLVIGGDADIFKDYIRAAEAENIVDRYLFHIEFTKTPQTAFEKLDIFCMTSIIEPFGRVNLEASCFKIAIIATNVDGVPEIVLDGITGLLIPPNNVEALKHSISKLLDNETLRIELGLNAYNRVQSDFTIKKYADGIKTHIQDVFNT